MNDVGALAMAGLVLAVIGVILGLVSLLGYRRRYRRLRGRMAAVRTLHQRARTRPGHPDCCIGCGQRWPCSTERAVR